MALVQWLLVSKATRNNPLMRTKNTIMACCSLHPIQQRSQLPPMAKCWCLQQLPSHTRPTPSSSAVQSKGSSSKPSPARRPFFCASCSSSSSAVGVELLEATGYHLFLRRLLFLLGPSCCCLFCPTCPAKLFASACPWQCCTPPHCCYPW